MGIPESFGCGRELRQFRGSESDPAIRKGQVPKGVTHLLAQLIACICDSCVSRPAVRTRVTAVFDKRYLRIWRTEKVVPFRVDGAVEPTGKLVYIHGPIASKIRNLGIVCPALHIG